MEFSNLHIRPNSKIIQKVICVEQRAVWLSKYQKNIRLTFNINNISPQGADISVFNIIDTYHYIMMIDEQKPHNLNGDYMEIKAIVSGIATFCFML